MGFIARNEKDGHRAYQCPDLNLDRSDTKTLNEFLAPVKLILAMLKNDLVMSVWSIIE